MAAADVPMLKEAVNGVLTALEPVPAEHRDRVIRSARLLMEGE